MEDLLKADIFFFITTVAVVILTILLIVVLAYFVQILRKVKRLTERVETKAIEISDDIDELRANIRERAQVVSRLTSAFSAAEVARRVMSFFRSARGNKSQEEGDDNKEE